MADQRASTTTLEADVEEEDDGCAHHWQIETPNGETSEGVCKRCGRTRAFLNYSQRKMMVRSVKSNGNGNSNGKANGNGKTNGNGAAKTKVASSGRSR